MRIFHRSSAILLLLAATGMGTDAQEARQRVDTSFAFERGGLVDLGIISGRITVRTGSANTISIVATIERGRIETSFSRARVSLEVRSVRNRAGSATFELTVPPGTRVHANAVSGDVEVSGTGATVEASSVSGDVAVRDASERVEVSSVSGDLDVSNVKGQVILETVSGEILADGIEGDLEVETVSGTIDLRRSALTGMRAESVSGDVGYDGPFTKGRTYSFSTHSGNVRIGLPANAGATLELETFSGHISSDFPLTLQPGEMGGKRERRMDFRIGNGGARIDAETFSGNITIRRLPARGNEE